MAAANPKPALADLAGAPGSALRMGQSRCALNTVPRYRGLVRGPQRALTTALLHFWPAICSVSRPSTSLLDPGRIPRQALLLSIRETAAAPPCLTRQLALRPPPVSWFARLSPRPRPATHHFLSRWRGRESCRPGLRPAQSSSPSAAMLRLTNLQRHRLLRRRLLSQLLRNRRQHHRRPRCQPPSSLASRYPPSRSPSPRTCPQGYTNRSRKGPYIQCLQTMPPISFVTTC